MQLQLFRLLLVTMQGYLWTIPILIVLGLLTSLAEGLSIGLLIPFFARFIGSDGSLVMDGDAASNDMLQQALAWAGDRFGLGTLAAGIVGLLILKSMLSYGDGLLGSWVSGRISQRVRAMVHAQLLEVGYEFISTSDNAKLLNTLDGESWQVSEMITTIFGIIMKVCMILVLSTFLILISWKLTLCVAVGVVMISVLLRPISRVVKALGVEAVKASEALSERSVELFDAMRMIRAFGQEPHEAARYEAASDRVRRISMRMEVISGLAYPLLEMLYGFLFVGIVLLAWSMEMAMPVILAFLILLYRLQPHLKGLDYDRIELAGMAAGVRKVFELLDRSDKPYLPSGPVSLARLEDTIRFEGVTFAYADSDPEDRPALDGVSLEIGSNKVTALVGGSGAGKSTLINLVYRFYDPTAGRITVDGHDLKELDLVAWRGMLAVAGQDAELLGGTVLDNIRYSRPGASREEVIEAAKRADAHGFISALAAGYETKVGERGLHLSGGQRQRIGLARALLRKPKILILDEATNAVDSLTENFIMAALEELRADMTVIIIAHRLSTTRNADHVVVLSEGKVAEQGSPRELAAANGLFARLLRSQHLPEAARALSGESDAA